MVNTFIHSSEHRGSKGLPSERGFVKNRSELRFPKFKLVLKILIKKYEVSVYGKLQYKQNLYPKYTK